MKKEYVFLAESPSDTQKKIKTWMSSGYEIEIICQQTIIDGTQYCTFTSLFRKK